MHTFSPLSGFENLVIKTAAPQHRSTAAPQHRSTAAPQHRRGEFYLLCLIFLCLVFYLYPSRSIFSQNYPYPCSMFSLDKYIDDKSKRIDLYKTPHAGGSCADNTPLVIRTVVHVLQAPGQMPFITDAQIQSLIEGLNNKFAAPSGSGMSNISFVLTLNPNFPEFNSTPGIARHQTHWYDVDYQNYMWPSEQYYNIFLVQDYCLGTGTQCACGVANSLDQNYASASSSLAYAPRLADATIMQVLTEPALSLSAGLLAHETGHYFGLLHTFTPNVLFPNGGILSSPNGQPFWYDRGVQVANNEFYYNGYWYNMGTVNSAIQSIHPGWGIAVFPQTYISDTDNDNFNETDYWPHIFNSIPEAINVVGINAITMAMENTILPLYSLTKHDNTPLLLMSPFIQPFVAEPSIYMHTPFAASLGFYLCDNTNCNIDGDWLCDTSPHSALLTPIDAGGAAMGVNLNETGVLNGGAWNPSICYDAPGAIAANYDINTCHTEIPGLTQSDVNNADGFTTDVNDPYDNYMSYSFRCYTSYSQFTVSQYRRMRKAICQYRGCNNIATTTGHPATVLPNANNELFNPLYITQNNSPAAQITCTPSFQCHKIWTNQQRGVAEIIRVRSGEILEMINCNIEFYNDATGVKSGIIVESGGKLILNNTTLRGFRCGDTVYPWLGVIVRGDTQDHPPSLPMTCGEDPLHGTVIVNNSTIRDSYKGVSSFQDISTLPPIGGTFSYADVTQLVIPNAFVANQPIFFPRGSGIIVVDNNSQFINNYVDVSFIKNDKCLSKIRNSLFYSMPDFYTDYVFFNGASANNCTHLNIRELSAETEMNIENNTFSRQMINGQSLPVDMYSGTGIFLRGLNYVVRRNNFINLSKGIEIFNSGAIGTNEISFNNFWMVRKAITANTSVGDEIFENNFKVPINSAAPNDSYGIGMHFCSDFTIHNNTFYSSVSGANILSGSAIAIRGTTLGSGTDLGTAALEENEINFSSPFVITNPIDQSTLSYTVQGNFLNGMFFDKNCKSIDIYCNSFEDCRNDWFINSSTQLNQNFGTINGLSNKNVFGPLDYDGLYYDQTYLFHNRFHINNLATTKHIRNLGQHIYIRHDGAFETIPTALSSLIFPLLAPGQQNVFSFTSTSDFDNPHPVCGEADCGILGVSHLHPVCLNHHVTFDAFRIYFTPCTQEPWTLYMQGPGINGQQEILNSTVYSYQGNGGVYEGIPVSFGVGGYPLSSNTPAPDNELFFNPGIFPITIPNPTAPNQYTLMLSGPGCACQEYAFIVSINSGELCGGNMEYWGDCIKKPIRQNITHRELLSLTKKEIIAGNRDCIYPYLMQYNQPGIKWLLIQELISKGQYAQLGPLMASISGSGNSNNGRIKAIHQLIADKQQGGLYNPNYKKTQFLQKAEQNTDYAKALAESGLAIYFDYKYTRSFVGTGQESGDGKNDMEELITHLSSSKIRIIPNPAHSFISLETADPDLMLKQYAIYDLNGREIQAAAITPNELICIESLADNMYIMVIIDTNGQKQYIKWVKE